MIKAFFIFLFFLGGIGFLNPSSDLKKNVKVLPPPDHLEKFHFGFKENMADLLWLDFIQRAYDCSKYEDPKGEHCPLRWGYKVLNTASKLAPKFEVLYVHGAVQLTVLLDDHLGAKEVFERGLQHFKDNWLINYRAAYLYLEELHDNERAAELMDHAAKVGAPFWTRSLASKLYDREGRWEMSYRILSELYEEAEEGPWKEELAERLKKIVQKIKQNSF